MKKAEIINAFKLQNDFEQLFKVADDLPANKIAQPDVDSFLREFSISQQQESTAPDSLKDIVTDERATETASALAKAAASGNIDPVSLLSPGIDQGDQTFILSLIKPNFSVFNSTGANLPWRLNQVKRTEILLKLIQDQTLDQILYGTLPETDLFGGLLRQVLNGNLMVTTQLNPEELAALTSVLESIAVINIPKPDLEQVKGELRRKTLFSDYHTLAEHFVGRELEINTLLSFINEWTASNEWRGLLMTGMGGAGKSAIIAKLADMLLNNSYVNMVIIDFDRPGVNPIDTTWMEEEISRQLGDQVPAIAEQQRQLRRNLRQYRQSDPYFNSSRSEDYTEHSRSSKEILYILSGDLRSNGVADKPLVIFFDTVEEIFQKEQLSRLYRWLDDLTEAFHGFKVKVVFSGRVFGVNIPAHPNIIRSPIEINEFDATIAEAFLKHQGLSTRISRDIIRDNAFPLRPLELKLIAKLLIREKLTYKKLLKELAKDHNGQLTRDMFVGIVYRRVLLRIDDKILRDFAYPGLIMRYINEDIVLQVLAPILHPEITTLADSRAVVNKLANYSWLAHKDSDGDVWHSLELRRSMLNLVTREVSEKVTAIRRRAIDYFTQKGSRKDLAEATYHKLFLYQLPAHAERFERKELSNAAGILGTSITELPKNAQNLLSFSRNEKVDLGSLNTLPDKFFIQAYEETCRQLVEEGLLAQAGKIYKRAQKLGATNHVPGRTPMKKWEKDLLFLTGYWGELRNVNDYWDRGSSLANLLEYVIPAALTNVRQIDEHEMGDILLDAVNPNADISKESGTSDMIARLTFGLVLVDFQQYIPLASQYVYPKLLHTLRSGPDFTSYGREANMLSYLYNGKSLEKYPLSLAALRLDRQWLFELRDLIPQTQRQLLIEDIIHKLDSYTTANNLLSFIDASRTRRGTWQGMEIDMTGLSKAQILRLTAGPNPIFRSPCRYALFDAMKASKIYDQVGDVIRELLPFKLVDNSPEHFNNLIHRDTLEALTPFIEILDRSWLLGEFMHRVIPLFNKPHRLNEIAAAYERWEKAYADLLINFRPSTF
jgi:hypothetical protein